VRHRHLSEREIVTGIVPVAARGARACVVRRGRERRPVSTRASTGDIRTPNAIGDRNREVSIVQAWGDRQRMATASRAFACDQRQDTNPCSSITAM
jgi:hypothetical protein